MWLDKLAEFTNGNVLLNTGVAGVYNVGDVIDLGAGSLPIYNVNDLYLMILIGSAVTSAGAATVQFSLASYSSATLDVAGLQTIHWQSAAIPKATLVAGYKIAVVELPRIPTYARYLGLQQTTAVAALTAGSVNAFLTPNPALWAPFADAIN